MKFRYTLQLFRRLALVAIATSSVCALPTAAQIQLSEYAARRTAFAQGLADGVAVAFGSPAPEEDYSWFYQNSRFSYFTGLGEAESALLMVVRGGAVVGKPILFVQPKDPAREVWEGNRLGVDSARIIYGFDARPASTLNTVIDSVFAAGAPKVLHVVGDYNAARALKSRDDQIVAAIVSRNPGVTVQPGNAKLGAGRRVKSATELDFLRKAIAITVDAHREAMRATEPGMNEFEIQALIEYTFRRNGADRPGFVSIVGSGPNSTTLHYGDDDRFIENGDVIVMDIGAAYRGYSADVTRTIPANGRFSPAQREIYQAVRDAQAAAEKAATVNGPARALSEAASASISAALARLGLIESAAATYDCSATGEQCQQSFMYYMHGLGHPIGLDVHDAGAATGSGNLVPGSAFTIEPGIYVRSNLLEILPDTPRNRRLIAKIRPAVEKYRNIGVRIEDDYIVTPTAVEWVSRAPREIAEVEEIMRERWTGPAPRDPAKVEWYRSTGRRVP
ncbi:MAG: Xaa-Pro aminopeptidase [Gemmatimonadota bacterium]|nr:Xaa-Pro aminopeptidase [Gemmatimonadota bacterium]